MSGGAHSVLAALRRRPTVTALTTALLVLAAAGPLVFGAAAGRIDPDRALSGANLAHPFGFDELGRDIFARVMAAGRLSLGISAAATGIGAAAGVLAGLAPAVLGRTAARAAAAAINAALAFPALLLALFVAAVVGAGVRSAVLAIALALTPIFARLTLTLAASLRAADYMAAARLLGAPSWRILLRHVLPNIAGPLITSLMVSVSGALLVLSGLSFLGLGVQPPQFDWGMLLNQGMNRIYTAPAAALGPAAAIALSGLALSLAGDALARGPRAAARLSAAPEELAPSHALPAQDHQPQPLLLVEGLGVDAPAPRGPAHIVRGVSFAMSPGERIGLVGESGSGKSMTALAITRLSDPRVRESAARLELMGEPLMRSPGSGLNERLRRSIGLVFQDPLGSFNPLLRIGTQLAEGVCGMSRRAARARAVERLGLVGLPEPERQARRFPHQLSGGMLQRAMIGLSLMGEPRLIVADEPTTALDVRVQRRILELLGRTGEETGAGLLLISHDLAVVSQACERVLVMYAGRIVEDLPTRQLAAGAAHPYTRALVDCVLELDSDRGRPLAAIDGCAPGPQEPGSGCAFAPRCPRAVFRCEIETPELGDFGLAQRVACWRPVLGGRQARA